MASLSSAPSSELAAGATRQAGSEACEVRALTPRDGSEARRFCLATIEEVFGHGYRPDWHADLDALVQDVHDYHVDRRGAFLVVWSGDRIVGTAGLRALSTAPHLERRFAERYPRPAEVGSVWRTYLEPSLRSRGIGARLLVELERQAFGLGYRSLYLHTSGDSPRSVSFWRAQGYRAFITDDDGETTVHLDKTIALDLNPARRVHEL